MKQEKKKKNISTKANSNALGKNSASTKSHSTKKKNSSSYAQEQKKKSTHNHLSSPQKNATAINKTNKHNPPKKHVSNQNKNETIKKSKSKTTQVLENKKDVTKNTLSKSSSNNKKDVSSKKTQVNNQGDHAKKISRNNCVKPSTFSKKNSVKDKINKDKKPIKKSKLKEKKKRKNVKNTIKKRKKQHSSHRNFSSTLVWLLIIFSFMGTFIFSTIRLVNKSIDKKVTLKEQEEIEEMTIMEELPEDEEVQEIVNAPKENTVSDYWKYVRLPLMKVNFNELLNKNEETVAFLKVNGTNINYPVVQAKDNDFYLDHSYDKTNNDAGWVFMDYRNKLLDFDANTIIYAHGMTSFSSENTTMFGSLRKILKSDWYQNTDNYVIYLSTPTISTLWQVFSVYSIPTETYYLTTNFGTKKSHEEFINTLVSRSVFDFNAEVNTDDKILTLSTCYDSATKVVMHAKLIKKQNLGE